MFVLLKNMHFVFYSLHAALCSLEIRTQDPVSSSYPVQATVDTLEKRQGLMLTVNEVLVPPRDRQEAEFILHSAVPYCMDFIYPK